MRCTVRLSLFAFVGFLSSCGSKSTGDTASEDAGRILALDESSGQVALEKRFADFRQDVVLDDKGNITGDSKRSSFENKQLTSIGGNYGKKKFNASRYSKKNFEGNKAFRAKDFGNEKSRWDGEEWFFRKQAQEGGTAARGSGKSFDTPDFGTTSAREQGGTRLSRDSDVETDVRRRVAQAPPVFSQEQYEKMSIEQSKSLLGR